MILDDIFADTRPYFDDLRFPHGFRRCGEFTIHESELLSHCGRRLQALEAGLKQPESEEEHRFLAVSRGERLPTTDLERVWLKYRRLSQHRRIHHTLCYRPTRLPREESSDSDWNRDD